MQRFDLVTFDLGGEPYALELAAVREVLPTSDLEPGGQGVPFVSGWVEVRGEAVPVVDLRTRFDLAAEVNGPLLLVGDRHGRPLALRVDIVREISRGVAGPLRPVPPYFGGASHLVRGLIDEGPRPTVVLDAVALLSVGETAALEAADGPPAKRTSAAARAGADADDAAPGGGRR